ncbi:MAG: hypothetical protein P4L92_01780 [Rudaea sp.]|nr:hypothetical protein [Rudaea sp.]
MYKFICVFVASALIAGIASATALGTAFTYQGQLSNGGSPANGNFDLEFALYTVATGGTAADTVDVSGVAVSEGLVNAAVDFTDIPFNGQALWVEVRVRPGGTTGAYTTLSPRQILTAAPYALFALSGNPGPTGATGAQGPTGPAGAMGPPGPAGPAIALPYTQTISSGSPGFAVINTGDGLNGITSSAGSSGVYGNNTGGGKGVFGASASGHGVEGGSTSGDGVAGISSAGSGVYGTTAGTSGQSGAAGVWGDSNGYYGVWGTSVAGDGVHGNSSSSTGAFGASNSGAGVWGESAGYDAVHGHTSNPNGNTSGVAGFGDGSNNGTFGISGSGSGVAGFSSSGNGVFGHSNTGYGMETDGSAQQARSQGGWAKAMAHVGFNGAAYAITRCFNSQIDALSSTIPPCGMVLHEPATGFVQVDFGFEVDDRFVTANVSNGGVTTGTCTTAEGCTGFGATTSFATIQMYAPASGNYVDEPFTVIVY